MAVRMVAEAVAVAVACAEAPYDVITNNPKTNRILFVVFMVKTLVVRNFGYVVEKLTLVSYDCFIK